MFQSDAKVRNASRPSSTWTMTLYLGFLYQCHLIRRQMLSDLDNQYTDDSGSIQKRMYKQFVQVIFLLLRGDEVILMRPKTQKVNWNMQRDVYLTWRSRSAFSWYIHKQDSWGVRSLTHVGRNEKNFDRRISMFGYFILNCSSVSPMVKCRKRKGTGVLDGKGWITCFLYDVSRLISSLV